MSSKEIDKIFKKVDFDKSDEIDYSEFLLATINKKIILGLNKL